MLVNRTAKITKAGYFKSPLPPFKELGDTVRAVFGAYTFKIGLTKKVKVIQVLFYRISPELGLNFP
jgi:hypothetical protein